MNYNFKWWNLPAQIKDKFDLDTNWFTILIDINELLRDLEDSNEYMYNLYYSPNHKVTWFSLLSDLDKILVIYED